VVVCHNHNLASSRVFIGNSTKSFSDVFIAHPTLDEVSCACLENIIEYTALRTNEGIIWNFVKEESVPECVLVF
jgi:hypothetical protein